MEECIIASYFSYVRLHSAAAATTCTHENDSELKIAWRSHILHLSFIGAVLAALRSTLSLEGDAKPEMLNAKLARGLEASNSNATLLERMATAAGAPSLRGIRHRNRRHVSGGHSKESAQGVRAPSGC